jgi:CBS domain-containing protein
MKIIIINCNDFEWNNSACSASKITTIRRIMMGTEFKVHAKDLLNKIEELIREGNVRRIIIKDADGKPYIEIPLSIGVIGAIAAPVVTAIGALAGVVANFTVEIIRKEYEETEAVYTEVKDDKDEKE